MDMQEHVKHFTSEEKVLSNRLLINVLAQGLILCGFVFASTICFWFHLQVENDPSFLDQKSTIFYNFTLLTMRIGTGRNSSNLSETEGIDWLTSVNKECKSVNSVYNEQVCNKSRSLLIGGMLTLFIMGATISCNALLAYKTYLLSKTLNLKNANISIVSYSSPFFSR